MRPWSPIVVDWTREVAAEFLSEEALDGLRHRHRPADRRRDGDARRIARRRLRSSAMGQGDADASGLLHRRGQGRTRALARRVHRRAPGRHRSPLGRRQRDLADGGDGTAAAVPTERQRVEGRTGTGSTPAPPRTGHGSCSSFVWASSRTYWQTGRGGCDQPGRRTDLQRRDHGTGPGRPTCRRSRRSSSSIASCSSPVSPSSTTTLRRTRGVSPPGPPSGNARMRCSCSCSLRTCTSREDLTMLDPDISTAGALRHLSQPDTDEWAVDRRRFLQLIGMGVGAGVVAGSGSSLLESVLTGNEPWAHGAAPIGATDGILVIIGMFGGNDGLNMVVPINDSAYYAQRANIADLAGRHAVARPDRRAQQGTHRVQALLGRRPPRRRAGRRLSRTPTSATSTRWPRGCRASRTASRRRDGWVAGSTAISARPRTSSPPPRSALAAAPSRRSGPARHHRPGRAGRPSVATRRRSAQSIYSSLRTISAPNATTWKGRDRPGDRRSARCGQDAAPDHPRRTAGGRDVGAARGDGPADQRQPRVPRVHRRVG